MAFSLALISAPRTTKDICIKLRIKLLINNYLNERTKQVAIEITKKGRNANEIYFGTKHLGDLNLSWRKEYKW